MRKVKIGKATVSGLCIGGNPFSGFSHQTRERSQEMVIYYGPTRIKQTLKAAEEVGINTFFGRTDDHILGIVKEYWEEGGKIQWFAQVVGTGDRHDIWKKWLKASVDLGATGAYMHGGVVDYWYANKMFDAFRESLDAMREAGVVAGFAGHNPDAHAWINDNLDPDFQMCSYYNPSDRSRDPKHVSVGEKWDYEDRDRMAKTIRAIKSSVVHYKVFAGGNKPIIPAFEFMGELMRPNDVTVVGLFLKDNPNMIAEDIALFEKYVDKV